MAQAHDERFVRRVLVFYADDLAIDPTRAVERLSPTEHAAVTVIHVSLPSHRIDQIVSALREWGAIEVAVQSASLFREQAVSRAREDIVEFLGDWPNKYMRGGKTFKELFTYEKRLSLWWILEPSQKNAEGRELFGHLCVVEMLRQLLEADNFDGVVIVGADRALRRTLRQVAEIHGLQAQEVGSALENPFGKHSILGLLARRLFDLARALLEMTLVRLLAPPIPDAGSRRTEVAFHTSYPGQWIDQGEAQVDRYYGDLPKRLSDEGIECGYIANFRGILDLEGRIGRYLKSLVRAPRALREKPGQMEFLEHHISPWRVLRLYTALGDAFRYLWIERFDPAFRESFIIRGVNVYGMLRRDLRFGFLRHLPLYLVAIEAMRAYTSSRQHRLLVLYLETYCIGRAFIYGVKTAGRTARVLGFQHSTVTSLQLPYVYAPREIVPCADAPYNYIRNMPIPDHFALHGERARELMITSGFPEERLHVTGSPRFDGMAEPRNQVSRSMRRKRMASGVVGRYDHVVALAGSYWAGLSERLIEMTLEAASGMKDVLVYFAAHPAYTDAVEVFQRKAALHKKLNARVWDGRLEDLLPFCDVYVGVHSMSAAEALAFGCVVILMRAGLLDFGPLVEYPWAVLEVENAEEMRKALETSSFSSGHRPRLHSNRERVVRDIFYCLDGQARKRVAALVGSLLSEGDNLRG